jgi:cysteine synthase
VSGACCLLVGFLFESSPALLLTVAAIWGASVVADSAQFSACVTELGDPRYLGTALTLQTCLGFLLTTVSIRLMPLLVDRVGWRYAFAFLAPGPVFGVLAMLRLRALPEAGKIARAEVARPLPAPSPERSEGDPGRKAPRLGRPLPPRVPLQRSFVARSSDDRGGSSSDDRAVEVLGPPTPKQWGGACKILDAMIPIEDIRAAALRIAGKVHRTPLFSATQLGERAGVRLFLKCESFQKTGSFKPRGALNKVLSLSESEKARGLVTVSAGNHAQAVAWAARIAGAACAVVMPSGAPRSKVDAVRGYGAEVILHGDRATLFDKLNEVREARGLTFVHPFDDAVVLAGAGTTGLEILEDLPDVDVVVVPVGGEGLLGGGLAIKQLRPAAKVIAVELAEGPGLAPALAAGKPVPVRGRPTRWPTA